MMNIDEAAPLTKRSWEVILADIALIDTVPDLPTVPVTPCWACGCPGRDLRWWHLPLYDSDGRHNERHSFLIHADCTALAEAKAATLYPLVLPTQKIAAVERTARQNPRPRERAKERNKP